MTARRVEPGLHREVQRLRQALNEAGDGDLIDHLCQLAGAARSHQPAGAGVNGDDRLHSSEIVLRAAAHHRQRALLGARLAARDGSVDEAEPQFPRAREKFAGDLRGGGGVVDEDRAGLHALERAGLAQRHGAQIVVIADASEHDIGALGRRARRRRGAGGNFSNSRAKRSALAAVRL